MKKAFLGGNFSIPFEGMKKHFIALGSSGSGKTVLCKAIIEEAILNEIPAILVDPQGDLASLALISDKATNEFKDKFKKTRITIFTPTSSKGIPICINPLKLPEAGLDKESLVSIIHQVSSSIAKLIGYDLDSDKGKGSQIAIYKILMDSYKSRKELSSFSEVADELTNLPESQKKEINEFISESELKRLIRKIKYLTVGEKELLFQFGVPLDITSFIKSDKIEISIIYLNTLENQNDKDFFVSMLATNLYQWMLNNPLSELQALFYIDEIAPYLPAGALKPLSKPILTLLFKQARKYGIGCLVSTQNPGDIDYKAFAQFGTWAIGRLTTKQDREKIKDALKSVAGKEIEEIIDELPRLEPGEFFIFAPDYLKKIPKIKVRRLFTEHKTLSEGQVKEIADKIRKQYEPRFVEVKRKKKQGIVVEEKIGQELHLPVNIDQQKISQIVEKLKKKKFFIGRAVEQVESLDLIFEPLLKTRIKVVERKLLKKEFNEYDVIFNGSNAEPMIFTGTNLEQLAGAGYLIDLSESQIPVLKHLLDKKQATAVEIALRLGLNTNSVSKILRDLHKKKLVGYQKTKSKAYLWYPIVKINIPEKIKKIATDKIELNSKKIENIKIEKPKIDLKKLSSFIRAWFGKAEIINIEYVYYPVYKIRLAGKDKTRKILVSAVNGKILGGK